MKFRHMFANEARKENCYEGFRFTLSAFDGNFISANGKFIAFCVEVGAAGAFVVLPVEKTGLDFNMPKINAHKEYILDLQWNPYDDNMIATCSEDGSVKIWQIPDHGIVSNWDDGKALLTLEYHEKRAVQIQWHPIASHVLLSVSQEPKMCIWNLEDGALVVEIDHPDIIYNASWNEKGDKIVTSCKDQKIRIFDARNGELLSEFSGHKGSKPQRVIFTLNDKYLFSTGFSRMSERELAIWKADGQKLNIIELDTANGCLIPYYDPDTDIVYLAAKGDSEIRSYQLVDEEPYFHHINTFKSNAAQRGLASIPRRNLNVNVCEVMRFYKSIRSTTGYIQPISFTVPRKSLDYQAHLYPDAISDKAAITASEWFEGKDAEPNRIDMITKYDEGASVKSRKPSKLGGLRGLAAAAKKRGEGLPT